jgi:hypothetical protein
MSLSPQLRALSPELRVLAAYIDAYIAYGRNCPQVEAVVETAWLNEARSGDGWQVTPGERIMTSRGWRSADDIFNEAGVPEKHRRVVELALWGNPQKHKGREFTISEIAEMTGHPWRTVQNWLREDMPRLEHLAAELEAVA